MGRFKTLSVAIVTLPITQRRMWHGVLLVRILVILSTFFSSHFDPFQLTQYNFYSRRSRLAQNSCMCLADGTFHLPFSNLLFPRVWAHNVGLVFLESHPDREGTKHNRAQEYSSFQRR